MTLGNSVDAKLRQITKLIDAGQKKEARRLLHEVLLVDNNNLDAWELLWQVVYNVKEEMICLNHILGINPNHASAQRRMNDIRLGGEAASAAGETFKTSPFLPEYSTPLASSRNPPPRRRKKRQSNDLLLLFLLFFPTVCVGALGFAAYRAGYIPYFFSSNLTATAIAQNNASCRALIEKAMQATDSFCSEIGSNKACYGNNTIEANLAPGTTERFSARGDIVEVDDVRRLSASPLKLNSEEWGVAVLKIIANLPRSLPGQTVTMVVFGNTTLDKADGNLESFFFTSELGKIVCEKVPEDGIMISVPDGEGVKFTVNGAEIILTGDAALTALKNGKMEVSLFEGSGRIVSDGQEQYFGAGQQVDVQLGGENGNESVGPPSIPESLSQDDLDTACALTGQFCSSDQITPVPSEQAQQMIEEELGITSTPAATSPPTATLTRTSTITSTNTLFVLSTWTPVRTPTRTRTPAPVSTATRTKNPTPISTSTSAVTPIPTGTQTPTSTATVTNTSMPTITSTPTNTATSTFTMTPTATNTPIGDPVCTLVSASSLMQSGNSLVFDLTNSTGGDVTIDAMHIVWLEGTATRLNDFDFDGNQIVSANETTSPSDYPSPNPFAGPVARRTIENDGSPTETFTINFLTAPTGSGYIVQLHFDISCQLSVSN